MPPSKYTIIFKCYDLINQREKELHCEREVLWCDEVRARKRLNTLWDSYPKHCRKQGWIFDVHENKIAFAEKKFT
jgi:hypothetical protein